jgi:low affinity Fe/Cu permease
LEPGIGAIGYLRDVNSDRETSVSEKSAAKRLNQRHRQHAGRDTPQLAPPVDLRPSRFARFSTKVAHLAGRPITVLLAIASVVIWAVSGPFFGFSENWQLVINTGTTIVTFLMVFIIQDSQNRDTTALHLKLDELIRATGAATNSLMDVEKMSQEELEKLRETYANLAHKRAAEKKKASAGRAR